MLKENTYIGLRFNRHDKTVLTEFGIVNFWNKTNSQKLACLNETLKAPRFCTSWILFFWNGAFLGAAVYVV